MNETKMARFVGSIPETYDRELGPFLFEYYAEDLAARLKAPAGGRVLEIACGTGISTEYARNVLEAGISITATDLNPPMLEHAEANRSHLAGVTFSQADAQALPFGDGQFDALFCQFGVMFLPDKPLGFSEFFRVLKPGGTLALNVWDSLERNPVVGLAFETICSFFESDPPLFLSIPFGWNDHAVIRAHLEDAGFGDVAIEAVPHGGSHPSAAGLAKGMVQGNPTMLEIEERGTASADEVVVTLAEKIRATYGDNPVRSPLQAIVATARKPE
ncbi:MAG: methyltransferase domain-containing protein [Rhodospirillaceae bacterium]|jgi:SAM-dependent methyltransferase|nr:methyltransferase domain-containing protein [Rhodospirillaceae bacterium]MBT5674136.1 methyltransferase domain-containing protein [Rhodospirillaceae bacterium]MBT5780987.1 methyltransferase domain-containing protein [Rhodospirillaceae bacterium]